MKKAPGKNKMKVLKATAKEEPFDSEKGRTYDPRPVIEISESDLPEIKGWTIDGKYSLNIKVEMRGIQEKEYGNDKGKIYGSFRVTEVGLDKD